MGKGNRTRNERASEVLAAAKPKKVKKAGKGMPTWVGTLIVVSVLVLLVLITTACVLNARGTFKRMRVVAESENYKITVPMMSYLISTEYQNTISMYSQYTSGTGSISIGAGDGGTSLSSSGSYTLDDLREIAYTATKDEAGNSVMTSSWFDYFAGVAEKDVRQILACCEDARVAGVELSEAELDAIEAEMESLKTYAELYGYTTNGYISAMYGQGVILKDVRAMMELTKLASKWSEIKSDGYYDAVTEERVNAYYEANKSTYDVYCDYIGYTFTATFTPSTSTDNADAENDTNAQTYKDEQAKYLDRITQLEACTTRAAFEGLLYNYLLEDELAAAAKEKGHEIVAGTSEYQTCEANARAALTAASKANVADGDEKGDLNTWLFDSKTEGDVKTYNRKPNDTKKIESKTDVVETGDNKYAKVSSTYSAYFFVDGMHRNTDPVRSVGHILFKSDTFKDLTNSNSLTGVLKELADQVFAAHKDEADFKLTAEEMAIALFDKMVADGKITTGTRADGSTYYKIDKDAFESYGIYTEDSSVFYDDVPKGQMVAEFENWLFDASRMEGEITGEAVKTSYGYHIMFYVGNEKESWRGEIKTKIAGEDQKAYLESVQEAHTITVNTDNYRYIHS